MSEPASQLEYAAAPPIYRRKAFRRALLFVGLLVLVICAWVMLPRYWRNGRDALQHRQWMRYTRPPTQVVFEPDPAKGRALWQPGSEYIMRPGGYFHVPSVAGFSEDALFLHGRRRPDGAQRVVWITMGYIRTTKLELRLQANVLIPATLGRPEWRTQHLPIDAPLPHDGSGKLPRIYAGQPDPNDESHFTMKYEFDDSLPAGVIHGWLRDNDTVDLEVQEGPLAEKESK